MWLQEPGLTGLGLRNRDWTPSETEIDGNYIFKYKSEKFHPHRRCQTDEVWISSVEGTQLMRYGFRQSNVNDSFLLDISLLWSVFLSLPLVAAQGRLYMLFWVLAIVIGIYSFR